MPYQKNVIEVKVPKKSGANMSHRNSGTLTCGTLTPLLVEEVIPGTRCHLKIPEVVQLPPLASDTYMNVKLKHEAFFVPFRLLCRSFEDWFADYEGLVSVKANLSSISLPAVGSTKAMLPVFQMDASNILSGSIGPGSLLDYLGMKCSTSPQGDPKFSPLSLIAYHLIWQEWYRNPRVQLPAFVPTLGYTAYTANSATSNYVMNIRDTYFHEETTISGISAPSNYLFVFSSASGNRNTNPELADGTSIFAFRQRNFGLDYFTGARVSPQQGDASAVSMNVPLPDPTQYDPTDPATSSVVASFTISQLRAMNSFQMFKERNNIPSPRMVDQVRARYNAKLADGIAQRPIFIGSSSFDVITRGVDQTAGDSTTTTNPFNSVANQYGRAYAMGNGTLIDDFVANEPGLIMVLQSLVPEVTYASGTSAYLTRYIEEGSIVEMANSLLQNIGDEPILARMLVDDPSYDDVFAYQDRYGTFMFHPNECHGLMADGQSLDSFVLKRSFARGTAPQFGSQFLEIPKNYLDEVFAVSSGVSGLSAWYDAKLEWKLSMPLAEFSIPSLQDPAYEHGDTVSLIRNGQVF